VAEKARGAVLEVLRGASSIERGLYLPSRYLIRLDAPPIESERGDARCGLVSWVCRSALAPCRARGSGKRW